MKLINDKYRKSRGGHARILEIKCSSCNSFICNYQKDGPGIIKRMYIDRIINSTLIKKKSFTCPSCNKLLGKLGVYEKENRPAFLIEPGSISKKTLKANSLT